MVLQYQELHKLANGHTRGVAKVVFSPDGTYLATGGLDGRICVWSVETGSLCYVFSGTSDVLELVWPDTAPGLTCSLRDGHVAWMTLEGATIEIKGFFSHKYPVECLAPKEALLASGAGPELSIWRWDGTANRYLREANIDEPPKNSHNEAKDIVVTSLHWFSSPQHQSLLAVTYLHHGIVLVDARTWGRLRTFPINGLITRASISEEWAAIAVSNALRGFDIYSLDSGDPLCTVNHSIRRKAPTPAIWIHGGLALLGGSTAGQLTVWDVMEFLDREEEDHPSEPRILYELPVPKKAEALAVAAHYAPETDEFFIAAGVMNADSPSPCMIWKTVDKETRPVAPSVQQEPVNMVYERSSRPTLCSGCFAWAVTFICIAVLFQTWSQAPREGIW